MSHRDVILDAAMELFSGKGFHYAKMEDIAAKAGLSAGTLYNYFKNKEELYITVIDENFKKLHQAYIGIIEGEGSFLTKIEEITRTSLEFSDQSRSFSKLLFNQTAYLTSELIGSFADKGQVWYRQCMDLFSRLMFQGIREGNLRSLDPKDLAHLFLGIQYEYFNEWLFSPVEYKLAGKTWLILDLFLNGAGNTVAQPVGGE